MKPEGPSGPAERGRQTLVRCWSDAVILLIAAVVLALSALPVDRDEVPSVEETTFEVVNDSASLPFAPVWVVMQLGNIAIVAVAVVAALAWRKPRLALGLGVGGAIVYLAAKGIKRVVIRARPDALLPDVVIRGTASHGLGFVSGHAAVICVLAVVAGPWLGRRARWIVYAIAAVVCITRVYVGAHLPLDVIGGAALGVGVGAALRLLLGRPAPDPEPAPTPA